MSIHDTLSQLIAKLRLFSCRFCFDRKIDKNFDYGDSHSSKKQRFGLGAIHFCDTNIVFLSSKNTPREKLSRKRN